MEWAFLALLPVRGKALVLGIGLDYFVSVFNGSDLLAVTGRDMNATWRSAGALCRELDWSKRRLIYELENGLPYRTIPPGWTIDWRDSYVWPYFNVEASEISIPYGVVVGAIVPPPPKKHSALAYEKVTLGIEVQLPADAPADAEVPSPSASASAASASAGLGYQAARVDRALDHLEAVGLKLSDYTDPELRRLALEQIPERDGEAPPSRQTVDRVIQRRRAK